METETEGTRQNARLRRPGGIVSEEIHVIGPPGHWTPVVVTPITAPGGLTIASLKRSKGYMRSHESTAYNLLYLLHTTQSHALQTQ